MPRQKATNCIQEPPMQACNAHERNVPPSFVFVLLRFQETRVHANVLPDLRLAFQFALSYNTCRDDLGVSQDRVYRRRTLEKPCRFLKLPVRRIGLGAQSLWIPRATISCRRAARTLINETKASCACARRCAVHGYEPDLQRTGKRACDVFVFLRARATNPIQSQ
ncbi:hypothetical protein B0H14DRAFT_2918220, partial [Mycena olivaceomarginata]